MRAKQVQVNRIEVIDHTSTGTGRDFVKWEEEKFKVNLQVQDDGRTLKVFLFDLDDEDIDDEE